MGNDVNRKPRARAKGFGHARGQAALAWLMIGGGAATCAFAVAVQLVPHAHPLLERAANVLGRAGLETSVLVLTGVGAGIAGLVLRAVSRFGRLLDGDREAANAIDELSRTSLGHVRAVDAIREEVSSLRGELARTQHAVEEHVQWSHTQAQENPVFRLAASLDQLWARVDQSVMAARDEMTHEVRNATVALRKVDDDALQQTAERIERGLVCVTQSIDALGDRMKGAVDAAERAADAAAEATHEARRAADHGVDLTTALAATSEAAPTVSEPSQDHVEDTQVAELAVSSDDVVDPVVHAGSPMDAYEPEAAEALEVPLDVEPEAIALEFEAPPEPAHEVEVSAEVDPLPDAVCAEPSAETEPSPAFDEPAMDGFATSQESNAPALDPLAESLGDSFDTTNRPAPEAWDFEPQEPPPALPSETPAPAKPESDVDGPRVLHLQTHSDHDDEPLSIEVQLDSAFEDRSEQEVPPPLPSERPEGLDLLERLDTSRPLTVSREEEAPPLFPDLENGGDRTA